MLGIDYQADETFSNVNGEGQLRAHFQTVRALHFNVDQKPVSADELTAMYALTGSYRSAAASATQEQVRSRILPTFRSVVSSFEGADGLIPNPLHITVFESRNPRRR